MMNSPTQQPAVSTQLEILNKVCSELSATLKALEERLTPALRELPQTPPGNFDGAVPSVINAPNDDSPLVRSLKNRVSEVENMQRRAAYLISLLQL
jgi:hypothetical protein